MKRESSAERALKAQIKILQEKMNKLIEARDELETKIETIRDMIFQFQFEVNQSKELRLAASESRAKP